MKSRYLRNGRNAVIVVFGVILLSHCASKEDRYGWVNDLPVEAESSFKEARRQDIRLLQLYEVREAKGQRYVRGLGYADVNDGDNKFHWEAKKPPVLEITVTKPDAEAFRQCQILFDQMNSQKRGVQILADGFFVAKGNEEDGRIGVFRIDRIEKCVTFSSKK